MTTRTTTIKGKTFTYTKLPFERAFPLFHRVINAFGEAIIELLTNAKSLSDLQSADGLGAALREFCRVDASSVEPIASDFGAASQCEGRPLDKVNRNTIFSEIGVKAFYEWLWFCFSVQFADFLSD